MTPSKMSPLFVHIIYILLLISPIFLFGNCQKLDFSINPGCEGDICSSRKLAYANFSSNDTSYHYYIDLLSSSLSILIIQTPPEDHSSDGHINWTQLANTSNVANALIYNDSVNAIGLVLGNLTFTQESDDESKPNNVTVINLNEFDIETRNETQSDSILFSPLLKFKDTLGRLFNISLDITTKTKTDRHPNPPGLLFNPGSVHVDFTMKGSIPNDSLVAYDFSLPFQLIQLGSYNPTKQDTIDDEFSPGVFSLHALEATNDTNPSDVRKSFVQFRPVAYLQPDHISTRTLDVSLIGNDSVVPWNETAWHTSATYGYFANLKATNNSFVFKFPASDVYSKSNFTTFTFTVGLGEPALEELSPQVVWIIVVGVGLPSLALVFGLTYMVGKKLIARRSASLAQNEGE